MTLKSIFLSQLLPLHPEVKSLEQRQKVVQELRKIIRSQAWLSSEEEIHLVKEIIEEAYGLGPLEDVAQDPLVTGLVILGDGRFYFEKESFWRQGETTFSSFQSLKTCVGRLEGRVEIIPSVNLHLYLFRDEGEWMLTAWS